MCFFCIEKPVVEFKESQTAAAVTMKEKGGWRLIASAYDDDDDDDEVETDSGTSTPTNIEKQKLVPEKVSSKENTVVGNNAESTVVLTPQEKVKRRGKMSDGADPLPEGEHVLSVLVLVLGLFK